MSVAYFVERGVRISDVQAEDRTQASVVRRVPEFTLKDLGGGDVSLSQFRGKVVLVNFWATWCGPCGVEIPWLMELRGKYESKGFTILGVAMDEEGGVPLLHLLKGNDSRSEPSLSLSIIGS